ncbi:MAG: oligopeptide transport system substrate-binding protein [Thermomicrobiales bacterium]|nr:oligopeptide transport system substrate-binding protein [Thermomicrobiales bacterium]
MSNKTELKEQVKPDGQPTMAGGVSRRTMLKAAASAAGSAALLGIGGEAASAATGASSGRALSRQQSGEQLLYNAVLTQGDPVAFDFNGNLYSNAETETTAGLLTFDENLNVVPDWAESWDVNADASVYTFHLRQGNKGWSDGTPVTAQDFVWSWPRALNPDTGNQYSDFLADIKYASEFNTRTAVEDPNDPLNGKVPTAEDLGLKAIDDWTLEVTLAGPRANFLQKVAYLAAVPSPRWHIEKYGDKFALGGDIPIVTNGPFKVDLWEHNQKVLLSKNENYWDAENIKLTNVVDPIYPPKNALLLFEQGSGDQQIDWTFLDAAGYKKYSEDPELAKMVTPYVYPGIWMLLPQATVAPFDNLQVRKALSHAIDRERISTVTNGLTTPAACMVPAGVFGFLDDPALAEIQKFDPAAAMEALKGTEFEGGTNWPEVTMYMRANEEQYNADVMAADIVDQIKQNIGLDIKIQQIPQANFVQQLRELKWPLTFIRWWYDYPDPDNGYGDMFYSNYDKRVARRQAWTNKDFDDLVNQGKAEPDAAKRVEIYRQAEQIIQEDVGYMPLVYRLDQYAFKPWVKGVPVNNQGYVVPDGNIFIRMLTKAFIDGRTE